MGLTVNARASATLEVAFVVTDVERSVRFYVDVLGFEPYGSLPTPAGPMVGLILGGAVVKLLTGGGARPAAGTPADDIPLGFRHITLRVVDVADAVEECKRAGVVVERGPTPLPDTGSGSSGVSAVVLDPDGNRVELSEGEAWAGAPR